MKLKKVILLIGLILTGPSVLLLCLLLVNSVNPMQLTFITGFKVENQSVQDIRITPIGTRGGEGRKGRLPIYMIPLPALSAFRSGHYHLKNGQSITILYDWDDVNFSAIAVETKDGRFYEYIVDPNPLQNQYHRPSANTFVIPGVNALLSARPQIVEVVQKPDLSAIIYVILCGSAVIFFVLLREYMKIRKTKTSKPSAEVTS